MSSVGSAPLSNPDVRDHNRGLLLTALAEHGPAARTELSERTGLSPGTVTALISDLEVERYVRPGTSAPARSTRGRPLQRLELDGSRYLILATQFLLDEYRVLVTDLGGRTRFHEVFHEQTPIGDYRSVVERLAGLMQHALEATAGDGAVLLAATIVVPGGVFLGTDRLRQAVDLGWFGPNDLADDVANAFPGLPVKPSLINDANAAAYAEYDALRRREDVRDVRDMIYIKGDTGIGGGAIVGGELLLGGAGIAFEPGHVEVVHDGLECACGQHGCLVTVAGPVELIHSAGLDDVAAEQGEPAALDEMLARYSAGDPAVRRAVDTALGWVRVAVRNAVLYLNPQMIVFGGYLAQFAEPLSDLHPILLETVGVGSVRGRDAFVGASGHGEAAVTGASAIARRTLLAHPPVQG